MKKAKAKEIPPSARYVPPAVEPLVADDVLDVAEEIRKLITRRVKKITRCGSNAPEPAIAAMNAAIDCLNEAAKVMTFEEKIISRSLRVKRS